MRALLLQCFISDNGVTAVEYGLIAALIAVAAVAAFTLVGSHLGAVFNTAGSNL